jgi:hypothetical protein
MSAMSEAESHVPPRVQIEQVLKFGESTLGVDPLPLGRVQMFARRARYQLRRIYGEEGPHMVLFSDPPPRISAAESRAFVLEKIDLLREFSRRLDRALRPIEEQPKRVFFGHGRSPLWRELKDFVSDTLNLRWDEFNRTTVAGITTFERLETMLTHAGFAFLVMTAEEEHGDASFHARANVVHELGLFQGRLGPRRAIVMLEDGCSEFSNIFGLAQIRFPKENISAAFENVRGVLRREGLISL